MHYIYIIYSPGYDRYYVGESVNPHERLSQHNNGHYKSASTSFATDWILGLYLEVNSRTDAIRVERYIKSMKSKSFINKLIHDSNFFKNFKKIVEDKFDIIIK